MKASWRYWIKSQISLVESTQLNSPLSCCQDWRGTWSTSPCTPRHHHHCHQLESCQEHSPLQCRSRAPWISVSPWTWSRVREMRDETLHHWISDNPGCWSLSLKSWFKPHVETLKMITLWCFDERLSSSSVHVFSHLPGDRMIEILVNAGAGVVTHQGEPPEWPAVHHSDAEGWTVHLLLRQLYIQELDILSEVWILVGILDHSALHSWYCYNLSVEMMNHKPV